MTDNVTRSGLREGDVAPGLELTGTSARAGLVREHPKSRYRLDDYRGRPVLLAFFSAAFTPT
jgi:peroxiredoxin